MTRSGGWRIARLTAYIALVAALALLFGITPTTFARRVVLIGYVVQAALRLIFGRDENRDRPMQITDGFSALLMLWVIVTW